MTVFTADYRVITYDTRGHGAIEFNDGEYAIDLLARDAAALIETLDIGPVHFFESVDGWNDRIEVAQTKGIEGLWAVQSGDGSHWRSLIVLLPRLDVSKV